MSTITQRESDQREATAKTETQRRRPYRISVAKYEAMVASGTFTKADRFELIKGILVEKMTKNPPHSVVTGLCLDVLDQALPPGWHTRLEQPVKIPSRDSEPEPDVTVARGKRADNLDHHPGPADVALVVEVADSTWLMIAPWPRPTAAAASRVLDRERRRPHARSVRQPEPGARTGGGSSSQDPGRDGVG